MFRGVSAALWFSWHSSCRRGMEGDTLLEPRQWEGVAAALPVVQKVLSDPARRDFWHFLMCDRKGASGKRSLLRPCCGQEHCGGGTGGQYSRRCPASLGAHLDQGLQAHPWHPLKEKRHGSRLKRAPPEGTRPSASCEEAWVLTGDPGAPADPLSPWGKERRL